MKFRQILQREKLRAAWQRLRGGQLSPARLSGSVALGLFIGNLPLYGLHGPLCVGLGMWLRLHVGIAYLATQISFPPLMPFLLVASWQLGAWLVDGERPALAWEEVAAQPLAEMGVRVVVGSVTLGVLCACVGGLLTYALASFWQARKQPEASGLEAETPAVPEGRLRQPGSD